MRSPPYKRGGGLRHHHGSRQRLVRSERAFGRDGRRRGCIAFSPLPHCSLSRLSTPRRHASRILTVLQSSVDRCHSVCAAFLHSCSLPRCRNRARRSVCPCRYCERAVRRGTLACRGPSGIQESVRRVQHDHDPGRQGNDLLQSRTGVCLSARVSCHDAPIAFGGVLPGPVCPCKRLVVARCARLPDAGRSEMVCATSAGVISGATSSGHRRGMVSSSLRPTVPFPYTGSYGHASYTLADHVQRTWPLLLSRHPLIDPGLIDGFSTPTRRPQTASGFIGLRTLFSA